MTCVLIVIWELDCGNWDILPQKYMYIHINTFP